MSFLGGSAFTMARDIGEGYHLITERTFRGMQRAEVDQLGLEIERMLREVRGTPAPLDDLMRLKARNRRIQRLNSVMIMLRAYKQRVRSKAPAR